MMDSYRGKAIQKQLEGESDARHFECKLYAKFKDARVDNTLRAVHLSSVKGCVAQTIYTPSE